MKNKEFTRFFLDIKKISVAELTLTSYEHCLQTYLDPDAEIQNLTPAEAQKIMLRMSSLSAGTQKRNLTILRMYYNYAIKYQIDGISQNPFDCVEKPRNIKKRRKRIRL